MKRGLGWISLFAAMTFVGILTRITALGENHSKKAADLVLSKANTHLEEAMDETGDIYLPVIQREMVYGEERQLVERFAPVLKFDGSATSFPMSAETYFQNMMFPVKTGTGPPPRDDLRAFNLAIGNFSLDSSGIPIHPEKIMFGYYSRFADEFIVKTFGVVSPTLGLTPLNVSDYGNLRYNDIAAGDLDGDGEPEQIIAWVDPISSHLMISIGAAEPFDTNSISLAPVDDPDGLEHNHQYLENHIFQLATGTFIEDNRQQIVLAYIGADHFLEMELFDLVPETGILTKVAELTGFTQPGGYPRVVGSDVDGDGVDEIAFVYNRYETICEVMLFRVVDNTSGEPGSLPYGFNGSLVGEFGYHSTSIDRDLDFGGTLRIVAGNVIPDDAGVVNEEFLVIADWETLYNDPGRRYGATLHVYDHDAGESFQRITYVGLQGDEDAHWDVDDATGLGLAVGNLDGVGLDEVVFSWGRGFDEEDWPDFMRNVKVWRYTQPSGFIEIGDYELPGYSRMTFLDTMVVGDLDQDLKDEIVLAATSMGLDPAYKYLAIFEYDELLIPAIKQIYLYDLSDQIYWTTDRYPAPAPGRIQLCGRDDCQFGMNNQDYQTLLGGGIPTYYRVIYNEEGRARIAYWWYYGWQPHCNVIIEGPDGAHHGDWEHILVTTSPDRSQIDAVTYYFHGASYTRLQGSFEVVGERPIVYVGKLGHGSYHSNDCSGFGVGTPYHCCEFADYRESIRTPWWDTHFDLISLDENSESWMLADRVGSQYTSDDHTYAIIPWQWGPLHAYCNVWVLSCWDWEHSTGPNTHPTVKTLNWEISSCTGDGCGTTECDGMQYYPLCDPHYNENWPWETKESRMIYSTEEGLSCGNP